MPSSHSWGATGTQGIGDTAVFSYQLAWFNMGKGGLPKLLGRLGGSGISGSEKPQCVRSETRESEHLEGSGQLTEGPESPAQDLRLGLEHAGLLPHGLLVVSIVVVDAPIRGHMLTPQGPLGEGGTEWWSRPLSQRFFSAPQRLNH